MTVEQIRLSQIKDNLQVGIRPNREEIEWLIKTLEAKLANEQLAK